MTAEDSDDDMEDVGDGIPMQGEDGQHYVVLEVRSGKGDVICCQMLIGRKSFTFVLNAAVASSGNPTARAKWRSGSGPNRAQWTSTPSHQVYNRCACKAEQSSSSSEDW